MMGSLSRTLSLEDALLEAVAHHRAGRLKEAEELYRAILVAQPAHPDANHNLGVVAMQQGQPATGVPFLKAALAANPGNGQYWLSYIEALLQAGQVETARQVLEEGRQRGLQGTETDALADRLARLEIDTSNSPALSAESLLQPDQQAMDALLAMFKSGDYPQAAALAQTMTVNFPRCGFGWKVLGAALKQLGRSAEALLPMQKAVALSPDSDAESHNNLGVVFQDIGRLDDAEASFRRAIRLKPDHAEAHYNLGFTLYEAGRFDEAIARYRQAILLKPDYADACYNLAGVLHAQGRLDEAVASYRQTLLIAPDSAKACCNLGNVLKDQGCLDEAVASYRQALALQPDYTDAYSNLIFTLDMQVGVDTQTLQEARRRWAKACVSVLGLFPALPRSGQSCPGRRLRIGYVSADFRTHSAATVFGSMLVNFDAAEFEVFAYANSANEDALTRLFQQSVTGWRRIVDLADEAVADLIRHDEIDILVDLSGHSAGNRLLVFARKPAPLQITAWGYVGGTGMAAMDVFLADPVVVPPEEKPFYTEVVHYLPCAVSAFFPEAFPAVNPLPAMTAGEVTFGSFNRLAKISTEAFRAWAQVLLAVPASRMLLKASELNDEGTRNRVLGHFLEAGVAVERITLLGGSPWHDHVAAYRRIDIVLDPFPHGGGVTTLESLMMGVPVVTLRWPTLVGRLSASILTTLGLTDWIAETPAQYVDLAVRKVQDLAELAELRQHLRARFSASIIGDAEAYVRAVERIYQKLFFDA